MTPIILTSGNKEIRLSSVDCAEIDEEDYYELEVGTRECNDAQRFVFESEKQVREFALAILRACNSSATETENTIPKTG